MWFRFRRSSRRNYHDGTWYAAGSRIESEYRLDLCFPNVFILTSEVFIPKPKRVGNRVLLSSEKRGEEMKTFVQVRQNLLPVPDNQGITKQHVTVLEGDTVLLDGYYPVAPAPEEMPTYWAEVGAGISVLVRYANDDGVESEPFRDDYIQNGIPAPAPAPAPEPEPIPEPEPEPVPPPAPEPAPQPVVLAAPAGLGVREMLASVDSETRPVQARRRRFNRRK